MLENIHYCTMLDYLIMLRWSLQYALLSSPCLSGQALEHVQQHGRALERVQQHEPQNLGVPVFYFPRANATE